MMMRTVAIALLLAGCSVLSERQQGAMNAYVGRPIDQLAHALGAPSNQQQVGAERWYVWSADRFMVIGGTPVHGQCRLSVAADAAGIMRSWRVEGNPAGCQPMFRSLEAPK